MLLDIFPQVIVDIMNGHVAVPDFMADIFNGADSFIIHKLPPKKIRFTGFPHRNPVV